MTATTPNTLRCTDRVLTGRGWLYSGPAPFNFNKGNMEDMARVMHRPWIIDHPGIGAPGGLWRVVGLDSYATWEIRQGSTIGLLVEPWIDINQQPLSGDNPPSTLSADCRWLNTSAFPARLMLRNADNTAWVDAKRKRDGL
jgi:hypothetical protein